MSAALSYSSGESATPLLGEAIGGNFDATVRAFGDREALVGRPAGRRWSDAELAADVDALALTGGKVRKVEMRERAVELLGLDAGGRR